MALTSPNLEPQANPRTRLLHAVGHWPLVLLGLLLRLAPLGRYVTPDEPAWVYRAIRFADALAARNWAAIPSTGHPGVTTMWLGALGVAVCRLLHPAESAVHLAWIRRMAWLAPENGQSFRHLVFFLPWGRVVIALAATLGLTTLYLLLVRLFDRRVALLTIGLLAFDPFLIGHSDLLHTDALLASFSLLAMVTALDGLQEPHRPTWLLSGLFTGLALLTKTPALTLLPFTLFPIAIRSLLPAFRNRELGFRAFWRTLLYCSLFILTVLVTYLALYPALWANPADILRTVFAFAGQQVEMAQRPIFFAGRMTYDPGPAFYPSVFLFRISPIVLTGLVIGLVGLRRLPADRRFSFLFLLAFSVSFGALMSLGVKKHDRYLLPALLPLTLAAAVGIGALTRSAIRHCVILALQALIAVVFLLYPLTCANLLAGGPWVAARVISVDWGEGMGAAARWLNQLPDADQLTVATDSVPTFAPLFVGRTVSLDRVTLADYIVQSYPHTPVSPYPITYTAALGSIAHAAIYTNTASAEQAAYLAAHAVPGDLILLDADTPLLRHYDGPGTLVSIADMPDQAAVAGRLVELSAGRSRLWLVSDPAASPITAAHLQVLESIADPTSTTTVASATITQYTTRNTPHISRFTHHAIFGDQFILIDALLPAESVNARFPVFLRWQTQSPTVDLFASLYVQDADDHLWAEVGQLILNKVTFPTSVWSPGEWADDTLTLRLPERISPGSYAIILTVTDADGAQLGAWDADGKFQGVRVSLDEVEIGPPAEPVGPAACAEGRAVAAEPFLVCIPELSRLAVPSGDTFTLALAWSATAPPQADYSIRWQLLDDAGSVALEQVTDISPYATSNWREGDSFEARYDLRLEPTLPTVVYTLQFNALAPDGHPLWAEDEALTTVEVLPRDRLFDLPDDIAYPLNLTLGDVIHLRGFDLDRGEVAPGGDLHLLLYWQGDGPAELDYTVFVHLVGPDGRLYGQVDRFPAGGIAPTTSWAFGQVVVDEIALPVAADAPAGAYRIAVGMYDAASGGRLPIVDRDGRALSDDQVVLPLGIVVVGGSQ